MSAELQSDMEILHESIVSHVGHSLNINSPSQLSQVLFNELDLPKTKKTKTEYSTDANSLEFLKTAHPIIEQILNYRELSKLKSTYVDALPHMMNPHTEEYTLAIIKLDQSLAEFHRVNLIFKTSRSELNEAGRCVMLSSLLLRILCCLQLIIPKLNYAS